MLPFISEPHVIIKGFIAATWWPSHFHPTFPNGCPLIIFSFLDFFFFLSILIFFLRFILTRLSWLKDLVYFLWGGACQLLHFQSIDVRLFLLIPLCLGVSLGAGSRNNLRPGCFSETTSSLDLVWCCIWGHLTKISLLCAWELLPTELPVFFSFPYLPLPPPPIFVILRWTHWCILVSHVNHLVSV